MARHNFDVKRIDNLLRHRGFLAALFVLMLFEHTHEIAALGLPAGAFWI